MKRNILVGLLSVALLAGPGAGVGHAAAIIDCFQRFIADMEQCATIRSGWEQIFCGLDAELALVLCVGRDINPWK